MSRGSLRDPSSGRYETLEKSDSGSSLKLPRSRRHRNSSIVKDFGHMKLDWVALSATTEVTVKISKWTTPMCCFTSSQKDRKIILDNVSGSAKPGELSFLMGASGAGKTTLLNCLYGLTKNPTLLCTGEIKVQGAPAKYCMHRISAYVEQEPMLLSCLTVWEHTWFHTSLRATDLLTKEETHAKVSSVLRKVGLLHTQHTLIGVAGNGISGGEKKRLSLATELISDPPILFADECTSGLDSATAISIVSLLKSLAKDGRTIILSIHQPSSAIFSLCDRLTLLSYGQTAFHGSVSEVDSFLEEIEHPCPLHYNLADHLMELSHGEDAYEMINMFTKHTAQGYQTDSRPGGSANSLLDALAMAGSVGSRRVPFWTQLKAVAWRSAVVNSRHLALGKMRLFQTLFLAVLLSCIFFQIPDEAETSVNKIGVICLAILNHTCIVGFSVMRALIADKAIYLEEKELMMYSTSALFISQNIIDTPFSMIHGVLYSSIIYWAVGFQGNVMKFFITMSAVTLSDICSVGYGMTIAALAKDFTRAQAINLSIFSVMALFIGNFLNPMTIPLYLKFVRYFCWMAPAVEIAVINELKDSNFTESSDFNGFQTGKIVLDFYGFEVDNYLVRDFVWLILLTIFYRVTALFALLLTTRKLGRRKIEIQKA